MKGTELFFEGQLADIRIWQGVRTPQEIQDCLNCRLTGNESGLMAYWPLNEGEGTTITDKTGNGNDGTISGAAWEQIQIPIDEQSKPPQEFNLRIIRLRWGVAHIKKGAMKIDMKQYKSYKNPFL